MTRGDQHKPPTPSIAEMEREIATTREQLGETIEELAAKADVPARARAKASDTAARVRAAFHRAPDHAQDDTAPDHTAQDHTAQDHGTAQGARQLAAGKAGEAGHKAAGAAHEVAARAGATADRLTQDRARTMYAAAALSLTAATVMAVLWARQHGDFDPDTYRRS
jgi:hypothetical protein